MKTLADVLLFENPTYIIVNPDRPNIHLSIKSKLPNIRKYEKLDTILVDLAKELRDKREEFPITVVYCENLESVGYCYLYVSDQLEKLQYVPVGDDEPENRIFAQYHKDYTKKMKKHIISELQKSDSKIRLVFATVALGMGLNAPNITRVIHLRPPTTLEKYVQEIGRAGRSGQQSSAVLYYNNSDIGENRKGLDRAIVTYVKSSTCLRKTLLEYFGFSDVLFDGPKELCCSNCSDN